MAQATTPPTTDTCGDFVRMALPVVRSARTRQMDLYTQHGATSTLAHTVAVSYFSLCAARRLHLHVHEEQLVRGGLLHDYFLYDWHIPSSAPGRWHGFTHPGYALRNATADFGDLTPVEKDLIAHHMFPLTPTPPHHMEGWLVCMVDKGCSLRETFQKDPWRNLPAWVQVRDAAGLSARPQGTPTAAQPHTSPADQPQG